MKIGKAVARKIVFPALMKLNIDKAIRQFTDHRVLNVMYHGVASQSGHYFSPRHISKDQFEAHLQYFRKNFDIITIPEAFHLLRNGIKPQKKSITISFDDGFQNNLYMALPLLEKYNAPATFFIPGICTDEMEIRCLWTDLIATLQYFHPDQIISLGQFKFRNLVDIESGVNLYDYLKKCPFPERDLLIGQLVKKYQLEEKILTIPDELWKLVTKSELIQMSQSKSALIGSHGYLHYNLGNLDSGQARYELSKSKNVLEETIQKEISMIGYPDGSYNEQVKTTSMDLGYSEQLAVTYQLPSDKSDLRILDRHGISSTTTFESAMLNLNMAFNNKGH